MTVLKPQPDRLYGRAHGKALRPRQEWLLENFLPRTAWPAVPFSITPREIWLEVGFGGGEHAYELARANPDVGYIAAEVFDNGICSLLSRIAPDGAGEPTPLPNLRLYTEDARPLLRGFEDGAVSYTHLTLPTKRIV